MSSATDLPSTFKSQPSALAIAIAYTVLRVTWTTLSTTQRRFLMLCIGGFVRQSLALVDSIETPSGITSIIYPAVMSMIYNNDQHDKISLKVQ